VPDLPLTGGCLCGGVRFELSEAPVTATYCHCTRCQRRSGTAASAQARIDSSTLTIRHGEELVKAWRPDRGWEKLFCSNCGSALFSRDPHDPRQMSVRLGVLDPGHEIRPRKRQFVAYAAAWEPIPEDGLPRYEESASRPR
jgi:hypothetical protein